MRIDKGFRLDERPYNQIAGSWRYAKNAIITKGLQSINNEEGFTLLHTLTMPVIGSIKVDNNVIIFSTNNTRSEIGKLDENEVYTTIINSQHLGFHLDSPIQGESKKNFKNETIVSWVSGLNVTSKAPCLLNVDNLPFVLDINKELVVPTEIAKVYLTPEVSMPKLLTINNYEGGNAPLGSIQFAIAYLISEVDITDFIFISNTIHNSDPDRRYTIQMGNLDKRYSKYRIVVINRQDTVTNVYHIGDVSTDVNTFAYNGQIVPSNYTLADILINSQSFEKVQAMTSFKDELVFGNHKVFDIDYQCFANNIDVKWKLGNGTTNDDTQICLDINTPIATNEDDSEGRTFQPFEVYALYIALIDLKGNESKGFHIPGRSITSYTEVLLNPFNSQFNDTTPFGTYDNISIVDGKVIVEVIGASLTTLLSFLNNFNKKLLYLNGTRYTPDCWRFDTVAGVPTRIYITLDAQHTTITEPLTGALGLVFDTSATDNAVDTGTGIKRYQNVDTSDFASNRLAYWENTDERYPNTNDFDICNAGGVIGTLKGSKVRHHRIPTHSTIENAITTNGGGTFCIYLENIYIPDEIRDRIQGYKVYYAKKDSINQTVIFEGFARHTGDPIINRPSSGSKYRLYSKLSQDYKPSIVNTYIRNNEELGFGDIRTPTIMNYMPQGNGTANPDREAHIAMSLPGGTITGTPIVSVERILENIHFKFDSQTTVATSRFHKTDFVNNIYTSLDIYDADTYERNEQVEVHSYELPDVITLVVGKLHTFLSEAVTTRINDGEPVVASYITLNDLKPLSINTGLDITTDSFPFRVNRSLKDFEETANIGWRTFLPNSYYDMPREKGEIWSLDSANKLLYIQHLYTLYTAQIKDTLKSDNITTYLGVGDIFDRQPDEVISTDEGYVGCQSKFSAIVCKLGYFVADQNQGKVFLVQGTNASEISNKGLRNFFKDNLPLPNDIDNPFTGVGLVAVYDEKWNRILLTKNIKRTVETVDDYSFTFSYSPLIGGWVSLHDYIMDACFNTRKRLYSIDNSTDGKLYKHNIEGKKGIYYNQAETRQTLIDVVFNNNRVQSKVVNSVNWVSDSLASNGAVILKDTLTHIMLYNNYQCTGVISLQLAPTWFNNIKDIKEETWSFNKFNDIVIDRLAPFINNKSELIVANVTNNKSWFNKNKFIGKFVIVRLVYDNISQNDFYLNDVNVNSRISDR